MPPIWTRHLLPPTTPPPLRPPLSPCIFKQGRRCRPAGGLSRWSDRGTVYLGIPPRRLSPSTSSPPIFQPPSNSQALAALDQDVASLLSKGATEEALSIFSPGFYGRVFVVPKSSEGWRPVGTCQLSTSSWKTFHSRGRLRLLPGTVSTEDTGRCSQTFWMFTFTSSFTLTNRCGPVLCGGAGFSSFEPSLLVWPLLPGFLLW